MGKPIDNMTSVKTGVAYKKFEKGLIVMRQGITRSYQERWERNGEGSQSVG